MKFRELLLDLRDARSRASRTRSDGVSSAFWVNAYGTLTRSVVVRTVRIFVQEEAGAGVAPSDPGTTVITVLAADWLFVVGISCEISGAALIAGEVLLETSEHASLRGGAPGSEMNPLGLPLEIVQQGPAYTWVGAALLALGFLLQLLGYVVAAGDPWFLLVGGVTLALTFRADDGLPSVG